MVFVHDPSGAKGPKANKAGPTRDGGDEASAKVLHDWSNEGHLFPAALWGSVRPGHLSV